MSTFYRSVCSTFRKTILQATSPLNLSTITNLFRKSPSSAPPRRIPSARRWPPIQSSSLNFLLGAAATAHLTHLAILSIFSGRPKPDVYQNAYEVEKAISEIVTRCEQLVIEDKLVEAKTTLQDALKLAEETGIFSNISSVYDLLSTIAFKEGGISEAEDMLVKFIEKLIQLGYPENHNSIVRFKLKLSRLYQSVGNRDMAELGFRDCINAQEEKMSRNKVNDELTSVIYTSALFWYGRFLTESADFRKAKGILKRALQSLDHTKSVSPAQIMVVLYYNAEVSYLLKDYDESLSYLYQAINLCKQSDPDNQDLPLYLIKVGYIHIVKGLFDEARTWCQAAGKMAKLSKNREANDEAIQCIETLEKILASPELNGKNK